MDEYAFPAKFMKVLIAECCTLNTMRLPTSFCVKYRESIPQYVTLVLRNEEEIILEYAKDEGVFVGMDQLFKRLDYSGGCIIAFQYNGGDNFWAHVISGGLELYADIRDDCGCKFVQIMASNSVHWAKFVFPPKFAHHFSEFIPPKLKFILKNGVVVEASFDKSRKEILGLQQFFRLTCLSLLDILLFTYYGGGVFDVSAFGGDCVEKPVRFDYVVCAAELDIFEIQVKPSHLVKYCLGVHIPSIFHNLTKEWKDCHYIEVHHASRSWHLQVKKRDNRTEIHKGWIHFRTDLDLRIGDYCVFKLRNKRRTFDVEVYKKL